MNDWMNNPHSNLNTGITVWSMQASWCKKKKKYNPQKNNVKILRLVHTNWNILDLKIGLVKLGVNEP